MPLGSANKKNEWAVVFQNIFSGQFQFKPALHYATERFVGAYKQLIGTFVL